jgi:multisubunit Na+/H+ antiporter MnhF subunit
MIELTVYSVALCLIFSVIAFVFMKDFYQRILCYGVITNIVVVFLVSIEFIDIAIIYILLSFIVNMSVLKYQTNY